MSGHVNKIINTEKFHELCKESIEEMKQNEFISEEEKSGFCDGIETAIRIFKNLSEES
ncbi:MAG: hypothetical protein ACI4UE_05570 [Candidatus Scatovivens sp.]